MNQNTVENAHTIRSKLKLFQYFDKWNPDLITRLSKISLLKKFQPEQIVLNGEIGLKTYVYFITEGCCSVIENLNSQATKFVCLLNGLACFNIGENLKNREIVAIANTECLLIPFYWLLENNEANIWMRIRQFLIWNVPSTEKIARELGQDRQWTCYKINIVRKKMKRKVDSIQFHNVPYSLKIAHC